MATEREWMDYPEPTAVRGGCKVSWNYYRARREANICAKAAKHNAQIALADGFDFGYCAPGSIRKVPEGVRHNNIDLGGMYEVCLP